MRPPGPVWAMPPPRPQQQWYPQNPGVSVPPAAHLGYRPQPLFPVQNMGMTLPISAPVVQPSQVTGVTPPGIPSSSPAMPVPQPLFPVVNNSIPSQASPFSTPLPVGGAQQPSHADALGSVNAYPPNNSIPGYLKL